MHIVVLYCNVIILSDIFGIEEMAAEKGRIHIIFIGSAIFVWTVKGGVLFLLVELFVEVDSSARRRAGVFAVAGRMAHCLVVIIIGQE